MTSIREFTVRIAVIAAVVLSLRIPLMALAPPSQPPTAAQVRAAMARGGATGQSEAWRLLAAMPVDRATVNLAVEVALAAKAPRIDPGHLPLLADRTARLSADSSDAESRLTACAVVTSLEGDVPCANYLIAVTSGREGTVIDRVRAWVTLRQLGGTPAPLPVGWESEVRGSSALELAARADLPPASRVSLLEPLITSPDVATQLAGFATLQLVPGAEALALWRSLTLTDRVPPAPSYPGARTQIVVGLARHGDAESLDLLRPAESQLPFADRLVLAVGRMERGDVAGRAALITMVNSGVEIEAIRAAEALAVRGPEPRIETRVRAFLRDGGLPLRTRWLNVAAPLKLGDTPEVIGRLADDSEEVRLAAALAAATAIEK